MTVYTYNDKVLKNVTTNKWLKKSESSIPENGVKIGNLIWSKFYAEYSNCGVDGNTIITINGVDHSYYWYNRLSQMTLQDGWRVPTKVDFDNLIAAIGADVNPSNWCHLFATYRGYMPDSFNNQYGTGWDEAVGFNRYSTNYYGAAIGWYDSTRIICGNYGSLYLASESSMKAPIVFCQDAT